MRPTRLIIKDFWSFEDLDLRFEDGAYLVQGENETEIESQESNGSGKSGLQTAMEYCILKTTSRKDKDSELIRFGCDEAYVAMEFECLVRKQTLFIERKINVKSGGAAQLSIDGDVKYKFDDRASDQIDKFLIEWIGVTKLDISNYFIVNKERYKSIFSMSNQEKIDLIGRFSGASILSGIDKDVEKEVKELNVEIEGLERQKQSSLSVIRTYRSEIRCEEERDFEDELKTLLNDLNEEKCGLEDSLDLSIKDRDDINKSISISSTAISKLESEIKSKNKNIETSEKQIEAASKVIKDSRSTLTELESAADELEKTKRAIKKKTDEVKTIIESIEIVLSGTIVCPKCKHEFLKDPKADIKEERATLKEASTLYTKFNDELNSAQKQIDDSNKEVQKKRDKLKELNDTLRIAQSDLDDLRSEVKKMNDTLNRQNREHSSLLSDLNILDRKIDKIRFKIAELKNRIATEKVAQIDEKRIKELWEKIRVESKNLLKLNKTIVKKKHEMQKTSCWTSDFKRFNMHLANESLYAMQSICNRMLETMKSDMRIRWEGYKIVGGKTKEEITPYIVREGEVRGFWGFSGGERARLDFAMIMTIQEMINSSNTYGGLQFLSTDEIGEGLDSLGLSLFMKSLEDFERPMLVTTHVVNRTISKNVLTIVKRNGISKIKE